ncbi:MAG: hypothetical protein KDB37_05590 [Ilumatobacter sp.]|nr:hypothetical protein [Ilumatobacter sp.]
MSDRRTQRLATLTAARGRAVNRLTAIRTDRTDFKTAATGTLATLQDIGTKIDAATTIAALGRQVGRLCTQTIGLAREVQRLRAQVLDLTAVARITVGTSDDGTDADNVPD